MVFAVLMSRLDSGDDPWDAFEKVERSKAQSEALELIAWADAHISRRRS